jgi:beta-glucanase (GH16 family)
MQRLVHILAVLCILVLIHPAHLFGQNYKLVWSDEFDGTTINPFKWVMETGGGGWGNSELENYTNRPANAYVDSGMLVIKALKENYSGSNYTSARMKTQGRISWKYGKIEARMKLPYGKGIWPAFWMLGDNITTVSWPKCGEIDIMEMIGGADPADRTCYGTGHWDNNGHASYGLHTQLGAGRFADDFHVFSIAWDSTKIIWYLDATPYCVLNTTPVGLAAFQKNFFIILNLAVGGQWPGNPDLSTVFPQSMYVDYVRVYQDAGITDGVGDAAEVPATYALQQNYPNPFNPSTVIQYSIPTAGPVQLDIFNVLGSRVSTLVDSRMNAGTYAIEWDARTVPSGVYFYRIQAGSFTATKRLIVQK